MPPQSQRSPLSPVVPDRRLDLARPYQLAYRDASGQLTSRAIQPVEWAGPELLSAYCFLRQEFRHFRLDRMAVLVPLAPREDWTREVRAALESQWVGPLPF